MTFLAIQAHHDLWFAMGASGAARPNFGGRNFWIWAKNSILFGTPPLKARND